MHPSISDARADGDSLQSWDRGSTALLGSALAPRMKSPRDLSSVSADSVMAAASLHNTPCIHGDAMVTALCALVQRLPSLVWVKSASFTSGNALIECAGRLHFQHANTHLHSR